MEKKCKVWNAFQEDCNDDELHKRYENFVNIVTNKRKQYNEIVPRINDSIEHLSHLEKIIFDLAISVIKVPEELLARRTQVKNDIQSMKIELSELDEDIKKHESLAGSYEKNSDNRLFVWYKALKSVNHPEAKNYADFKKRWGNKII